MLIFTTFVVQVIAGQLVIFYGIFYAVLAALFAICMQGLFANISNTEPTWTLDSSLIGTNPGLGFRPISNRTEEGSLIWYNMTNQTQITRWVSLVNDFLEPYRAPQKGDNYVNCDFGMPPENGKVCITDISKTLGNCTEDKSYGYNSRSPCIFLKLNRIFGWKPDYHTSPLPEMPEDLRQYINGTTNDEEKKQVWVSCHGVDDVDREHVIEFEYFPKGFASYYYPYQNFPNYISPIIAVKLKNVVTNVIISVECRAWAKNIEYRGGSLNRAGSVQFEVQVDDESHREEPLLPDRQPRGKNINFRTSTPILERRSLQDTKEPSQYERWCKGLEKSFTSKMLLNNGAKVTLIDESILCGHIRLNEEMDIFNQPIIEDAIKNTLTERIINLFNGSYKAFIRNTASILSKKNIPKSRKDVVPKRK